MGSSSNTTLPRNEGVGYYRRNEEEASKDTYDARPSDHLFGEFIIAIWWLGRWCGLLGGTALGLWGLCHLMFSDNEERYWLRWLGAVLAGAAAMLLAINLLLG